MDEVWKEISDINGYFISSQGRVKSTLRGKEIIRKTSINKCGYEIITINRRTYYIHKLVYRTFISNNTIKGYCIDHINGDKTDNRISNLQYITNRENIRKGKKGVLGLHNVYKKKNGNYQVLIQEYNRSICIGTFSTMTEAIRKRDSALQKINNGESLSILYPKRDVMEYRYYFKRGRFYELYRRGKYIKAFKTLNEIEHYIELNKKQND